MTQKKFGIKATNMRRQKKLFKFNVNQMVRFKLSKEGEKFLDKVNQQEPYKRFPLIYSKDENGYCRDQLWHVMEIFGETISLGSPTPFYCDIILEHNS